MKPFFTILIALFTLSTLTLSAADKLLWQSKDAGKNGSPKMSFWASKQFKGGKFTLAKQGKDGSDIVGFSVGTDTKDESATLIVHLPATPGKTYIVRVKAKAENPNEDSKIFLMGVAQSEKKSIAVLPRKLLAPIFAKYAEYEWIAKAPGGAVWDQTKRIQFSFCARNLKGGKLFLDDIRIYERP